MIENVNISKNPSTGEFLDIKKYIGVASVNILAINPNNEKLRKYGWSIAEDAPEPEYAGTVEIDGKTLKSCRVRFLVQIKDLEGEPVIPLDFWCRQGTLKSKDGKYKIIDKYGRTAWATEAEAKAGKIPVYKNGEANIATPYKPCHSGEEELIKFLMKYLNITPLEMFDRNLGKYTKTKNPGCLTIDDWNALCGGNMTELASYVSMMPDNKVKVILGVKNTDDNRTFQTFMNTTFIGNSASPDIKTNEYPAARKAIDRFFENRMDSPLSFSATKVTEWKEAATDVTDQSGTVFESEQTGFFDDVDDLPFDE